MAATRRSTPADAAHDRSAGADPVRAAVAAALAAALPAGGRAAVALSGGRDSMALLDAAAHVAADHRVTLVALHVHHGLSAHADAWADHCAYAAAARAIAFDVCRVAVARRARESLEDVARRARRTALDAMARAAGASAVMLAHHQDDQAETLLLQLLRGAGPRGLAAMAPVEHADGLAWVRPLLGVPRGAIDDYVVREQVAYVDDDSNARRVHRRNALRLDVVPALRALAPGYPATLARAATHQAEAATLLHDLAALDAAPFHADGTLQRSALSILPPPRARNVLRWFLHEKGLPPPSAARLAAMLAQLAGARDDARVSLLHAGRTIGLHRGRIVVHATAPAGFEHAWAGAAALVLPHGTLACRAAERDGLDPARLFAAPVTVRSRAGGERLRTRPGGPLRELKDVLREAGVPAWDRASLPLVFAGPVLAAVPGIASDPDYAAIPGSAPGVRLVWSPHVA